MGALLQFLTIVLPQFPALAKEFRDAFTKVGGDGADYDKILADNQIDIDALKNPESLRHGGTPVGEVPPPAPGYVYNALMLFPISTDEALKLQGAQAGDQVGTGSLEIGARWEVAQKGKIFWHTGITYLRTIQ